MHELLEAACEHRQEKLGLQKRVKTLEQDLAVAKKASKDQEYHIAQVAAGGGPDIAARIIGQKLSTNIGQAVVIDNRVGATGIIGADLADEGGLGAEGGEAHNRIGGGAARDHRARTHGFIEAEGARLVDQHHAALVQIFAAEKVDVRAGDDVYDRIAEAQNIILPARH
jgi:hypothetical protein